MNASPLCISKTIILSNLILFDRLLEIRPGFHYTRNATTTTQKQIDYRVEQSSFTLIALF